MLGEPSQLLMAVLAVCSLFLAVVSWRYIEKPFRNKQQYARKHIFLLSAVLLTLLITFGLIGHLNLGFEKRYSQELVKTLKDSNDRDQSSIECFLKPKEDSIIPSHPIKGCKSYFVDNSASVMMIGDSHLDTIGSYLQHQLYKIGIGSYAVSYPGCPPFIGLYRPAGGRSHKCHEYNKSMLDYAKLNGITDIILIAEFPHYLNGTPYDNGEGGIERKTDGAVDTIDGRNKRLSQNNGERILRVSETFRNQLSVLSAEFRLFVFGPVPEVGWDVPKYYAHKAIYNDAELMTHTHSFINHKSRVSNFINIIDSIDSDSLYLYEIAGLFCNKDTERCAMNEGRELLYRDENHLSMYGAKIVAKEFIKKFGISFSKKE